MTNTRQTIRDEIVQRLLHGLEKDLSDLRNLSDIRIRFIPRQALIDTITRQQVVQLLENLSVGESKSSVSVEDVAHYISPPPEGCQCGRVGCTGARMILATLLLIGREDLVKMLFPSAETTICDNDLPFDSKPATEETSNQGGAGHEANNRSPTQRKDLGAENGPAFFYRLSLPERALFSYWQWQVVTPCLSPLNLDDSHETGDKQPDECSLPWQALERVGTPVDGEISYVQKIRIFPGNHNLAQHKDHVFALKTFDERLVTGLTQERFAKELRANRNAPQHSRIVPVLAAFQHRRRCHLIFPWADSGSLADVWEKYSPTQDLTHQNTPTAPRFTESWLLSECIGIAEALAATHGFTSNASVVDDPTGPGAQIHADIKPQNILCFFSAESGTRSLTLKLADLGEAIRVNPGAEIKAHMVPHTKTYRPPEPDSVGRIGLEYDTWCLGCLYLDFITWFLLGKVGVQAFGNAREMEGDDPFIAEADWPKMIEDIFFKRVRRSRIPSFGIGRRTKTMIRSNEHITQASLWFKSTIGIEHKVKQSVRTHLETLKKHEKCESSMLLKGFIDYIAKKMLIVDTEERAQSNEVVTELKALRAVTT